MTTPPGVFFYQRNTTMSKLPEFLLKLMHSDAYMNQLHPNYQDVNQRVSRYMQMLFPGKMTYDSAGRLSEPEYDMTLEQFNQAQQQIDADFEDEKQEKEQEVWDEYEETFEIMGYEFDIENFIFPGEQISKRVLYPDGMIITKYLETQIVDVPEFKKLMRVWIWHAENGPNMCDECGVRDGAVFFDVADIPSIPVHPNCRCRITEDIINQDGKIIQSKKYEPKGKSMNDINFDKAYANLKEREGGYTDGKNQVNDEPTNMGIKQSTLNKYAQKHPEKNFPVDVKDLKPEQAREIYKENYWDNTKIPQIENERIRNAVFDMNVMGGVAAANVLQNTLNSYLGAGINVDSVIGSITINTINSISKNQVNEFMTALKQNRIESLQKMPNWPTAKGGWTKRTNAY